MSEQSVSSVNPLRELSLSGRDLFEKIDEVTDLQERTKVIAKKVFQFLAHPLVTAVLAMGAFFIPMTLPLVAVTLTCCVANLAFAAKAPKGNAREIVVIKVNQQDIPQLKTRQIRALASLDLGEKSEVEKRVLSSFFGLNRFLSSAEKSRETLLSAIPKDKVDAILRGYGLPIPLLRTGTVGAFIDAIATQKQNGLTVDDAWSGMAAVLNGFYTSHHASMTEKQRQLILAVLQRTSTCADNVWSDWLGISYLGEQYKNSPNIESYIGPKIERLLDKKMSDVEGYADTGLGVFTYSGWKGHFVALELQKLQGRYYFTVGNAGEGSNLYHRSEWNLLGEPKVQGTLVFVANTAAEARETLGELIRIKASRNEATSNPQVYYTALQKRAILPFPGLPLRPIQKTGNCAFRSQEELLYFVFQRSMESELANRFQKYLIEVTKAQENLYPNLADAIREQDDLIAIGQVKPVIEPLIA